MQNMENRKRVVWVAVFLAVTSFGLAGPSARAQSVAGWPERDDFKIEQPERKPNPPAALYRDGKFEDDNQKKSFDEYYTLSLFPNITNLNNRQSKDDVVARIRTDLGRCANAPDQQVKNELIDLTLDYMLKKALDSHYHPVVRMNAVIAISELDSLQAAKTMMDIVFGSNQVFANRVVAMSGLVRLAGPSGKGVISSDPAFEASLIQNMVKLVKMKKKGAGADGVNWIRGQAADVLAGLGSTGANDVVPQALLVMLDDTDLPVPLRAKAAKALGKLSYNGAPPAGGTYLKGLAAFTAEGLASCEQTGNRGRARQVARDALEGVKPFEGSTVSIDQQLIEGLKKALLAFSKETESAMDPEPRKAAITKAREAIESLLRK
jgi:hypothetical protein